MRVATARERDSILGWILKRDWVAPLLVLVLVFGLLVRLDQQQRAELQARQREAASAAERRAARARTRSATR